MRIVIVEDEKLIREGLAEMIRRHTDHVLVGECKNGREGIGVIQASHPDLVITDIRMNDMDGLEMLTFLHQKGEKVCSIIISGYSEFEYARQAMRLGVEEYLLKPVSIDVLQETLERIEKKLLEQRKQITKQPENYVREYFFGSDRERCEAGRMLAVLFPEEEGKVYGVLLGYYGNKKAGDFKEKEFLLRNTKSQFPEIDVLEAWNQQLHFKVAVLKGKKTEIEEFVRVFDGMLEYNCQFKKKEIPWGIDFCERIEEWKQAFLNSQKALSSCLTLGCSKVVCAWEDALRNVKGLVYPIHIDKKIMGALGKGDNDGTREGIEEFLAHVVDVEYDAEEIRHNLVKLMSNMSDTAKEINQKAFASLREKDYIKAMLHVYTIQEMKEILQKAGQIICDRKDKNGIGNYTINRTLEYIRNHYKEGISLEKAAEVLNITPEYLSMLFKREMGMNFSVFLKKFRISHAKRLLKETDMKIYEVAQECGYSNSNYFARIFKEVTGVSPAEYR